ncbi:MAG: MFS transporter [Candidatus Omnitrophica bacterium]|nr:MFS transporter [Candidatus Omnitrophota bacterium]MBU4333647.1 MFS transporter [Candidatus Omnitrophota bacterium]
MKKRPMYRYLIVLTVAAAVGLQGWRTLFNNFAVDVVRMDGFHIGMIQSVREVPGFLALLAIFLLHIMKEHSLSSVSIMILGAGVMLTGIFPTYTGLMLTTLLMSLGFHYYETTNQSLTLQYFDEHESPIFLGLQRSLSAAASIGIGVFIFLLSPYLSFKLMFFVIGLLVVFAGAWSFTQDPVDKGKPKQHKKMIFKRKYSLFYLLTLLSGARRQIFVVFSVFLLVKKFHFSVQEITVLFVVNNIINYFFAPFLGKAIVRFGEKRVLMLEYSSLIIIFIFYAFVESRIIVAGLYILNHIFFNFAFAIRTYFQKIADPKDIAPSMAVSFTINHLAAVILPAVGGLLWLINYRIPFIVGAVVSMMSLCSVFFMRNVVEKGRNLR